MGKQRVTIRTPNQGLFNEALEKAKASGGGYSVRSNNTELMDSLIKESINNMGVQGNQGGGIQNNLPKGNTQERADILTQVANQVMKKNWQDKQKAIEDSKKTKETEGQKINARVVDETMDYIIRKPIQSPQPNISQNTQQPFEISQEMTKASQDLIKDRQEAEQKINEYKQQATSKWNEIQKIKEGFPNEIVINVDNLKKQQVIDFRKAKELEKQLSNIPDSLKNDPQVLGMQNAYQQAINNAREKYNKIAKLESMGYTKGVINLQDMENEQRGLYDKANKKNESTYDIDAAFSDPRMPFSGVYVGVKRLLLAIGGDESFSGDKYTDDKTGLIRRITDATLGTAGAVISAMPKVAAVVAIAENLKPIGKQIGGQTGETIVEVLSHLSFGARVALSIAASHYGAEGVRLVIENTPELKNKIPEQDAARITEAVGHALFFASMPAANKMVDTSVKKLGDTPLGNTAFIKEQNIKVRQNEIRKLEESVKKEKDPVKLEDIKKTIDEKKGQLREVELNTENVRREVKKIEKEIDNIVKDKSLPEKEKVAKIREKYKVIGELESKDINSLRRKVAFTEWSIADTKKIAEKVKKDKKITEAEREKRLTNLGQYVDSQQKLLVGLNTRIREIRDAKVQVKEIKTEPLKEEIKTEPLKEGIKTEPLKEGIKTEPLKKVEEAKGVKELNPEIKEPVLEPLGKRAEEIQREIRELRENKDLSQLEVDKRISQKVEELKRIGEESESHLQSIKQNEVNTPKVESPKEIWEMTKNEYQKTVEGGYSARVHGKQYERIVKQAIREGKNVPEEVIKKNAKFRLLKEILDKRKENEKKVEEKKVEEKKVEEKKVEEKKVEEKKVEEKKVEEKKVEEKKVEEKKVETEGELKERIVAEREAGKRTVDGVEYVRKTPEEAAKNTVSTGVEVDVRYERGKVEKAELVVAEAGAVYPTHKPDGTINPNNFVPDSQPRKRESLSQTKKAAEDRANNLNPKEMIEGQTAFSGAPNANARNEIFQGTGRSSTLQLYWELFPNDPKGYKQAIVKYLDYMGASKETIDAVNAMKKPILFRRHNVKDDRAVELGYKDQKSVEDNVAKTSGGAAGKLTSEKQGEVIDITKRFADKDPTSERTLRDMIGEFAEDFMNVFEKVGLISKDGKEVYMTGNKVNTEGIDFIYKNLRAMILGRDPMVEKTWDNLPHNIREGMGKSMGEIFPAEGNILPELRQTIELVGGYAMAKKNGEPINSFKEYVDNIKQGDLLTEGRNISPVAEAIAVKLLETKTQKEVIDLFKAYKDKTTFNADKLQGTLEFPGFDGASPWIKKSKIEALEEVFGVERHLNSRKDFEAHNKIVKEREADNNPPQDYDPIILGMGLGNVFGSINPKKAKEAFIDFGNEFARKAGIFGEWLGQTLVPPPIRAKIDKTFGEFYDVAYNKLVRKNSEYTTEIMNIFEPTMDGLRKLSTVESKKIADVLDKWTEKLRDDNKNAPKTVDEVIREFGVDKKTETILRGLDESYKKALEIRKIIEVENLLNEKVTRDLEKQLNLTSKEKKEIEGFLGKVDWDTVWDNPINKQIIAHYMVNKKYDPYKDNFYINRARPLTKKDYVVSGKDEKGNDFFTYFETLREAKEFQKEAIANKYTDVIEPLRVSDLWSGSTVYKDIPLGALEQILNTVDLSQAQINKILTAASPNLFNKHFTGIKYHSGLKFSTLELEKGFGNFMREALAGVTRGAMVELKTMQGDFNVKKMEKLRDPKITSKERRNIRSTDSYIGKYINGLQEKGSQAMESARSAMYMWHLGFAKPSYILQNTVENFQTVLPMLVAERGFVKGSKLFAETHKATMDYLLAKLFKKTYKDKTMDEVISIIKSEGQLKNLLTQVLLGVEQNPTKYYSTSRVGNAWNNLKVISSSIGTAIDYTTKLHAMVILYRMAKERGIKDKKDIANYISKWITLYKPDFYETGKIVGLNSKSRSHGTSAKTFKNLVFTYQNWAAHNAGQYAYLAKGSNKHKVQGLVTKAVVGTTFGGIRKMPVLAGLIPLVDVLVRMASDNNQSLSNELNKIADEVDKNIPGLGSTTWKGAPDAFGVDMSGMFGQGTILDNALEKTAGGGRIQSVRELMYRTPSNLFNILVGAQWGLLDDIVTGGHSASLLLRGAVEREDKDKAEKNAAKMLPTTFKNMLRAESLEEEGLTYRNKTVIEPKDITKNEKTISKLGLTPSRFSREIEKASLKSTEQKIEDAVKKDPRIKRLLDKEYEAKKSGNERRAEIYAKQRRRLTPMVKKKLERTIK